MTANPKCSSPIKPLAIGAASIDDTSLTPALKLEKGAWNIVHVHNSIPVANIQSIG